jgi:hypothetical protein
MVSPATIHVGAEEIRKGMPTDVYQSIINCVDDSKANDVITQNALDHFVKLFPKGGWSAEGIQDGAAKGYEYAWTGIIGMVSLLT